jgi:hypothetical protein
MPDLIILIPNHGYSESDFIYYSPLDINVYVRDPDAASYKISTDDSDNNLVQFTETITTGFVRQVDATDTAIIDGLEHLEGETVKVTSNGEVVGTETVVDGSITISSSVFTYQVGLQYKFKVRSMRLAVPQQVGTIQAKIKRVIETVTRYIRSSLGKAGTEYEGTEYLTELNTEFSTDAADNSPDTRASTGGFNKEAYTVITSDEPVPFTVLATIIEVELE